MAYDDIVQGAASNNKIIEVAVRDSSTGQMKASIAYGSVTYSYIREGSDSTKATGTCVDMTLDTYTDHGWKETGIAGIYQFCVPNNALAAGKNAVTIKLTSSGAIDVVKRILITGSDLRAAALTASIATLPTGTGAGQISLSSGAVTLQASQHVIVDSGTVSDTSGTTTLLSRLTATRAGYLDQLEHIHDDTNNAASGVSTLLTRVGTPTNLGTGGATLAGNLSDIDAETDAIKAVTDKLDTMIEVVP